MPVPNQFANVTTSIPLSQLDANFNTPITLGNTAIQLGNTVTTLNNMTLANVTVTSGNVTITNVSVTTANVTTANIANVIVTGTGTFAAGSNTAPSITFSGDTDTGIFSPGANTLAFTTNGTEDARFDSSGRMLVGLQSAITSWGSGGAQQLQVTASGARYPGISSYAFSNTAAGDGAMINLGRSRSTTVGTMTATQSSDVLGYLIFEGVNSSNALVGGAYINVVQSGAAGASYIPAEMRFYTSDATNGNIARATINSTGAFVLQGGDTSANGIGITFPATQSASSNANTLDDYEEGTWTPTIIGSSSTGTGTYTTQQGTYTKIGNTVRFQANIVWTAHTGTGQVQVGNYPFASTAETTPISLSFYNGTLFTSGQFVQAYKNASDTTSGTAQTNPTTSALTSVVMTNAGTMLVSGVYKVA